MDEENRDEYFRSLITQPPNELTNESNEINSVLKSAFARVRVIVNIVRIVKYPY